GFAIATGLAREGARVIVNGRSEKAVAEAKAQIDQTVPDARVESFAGDLSTAASTETLLQRFPLVDILVNNLGIFEPKSFGDISDEEWRRFFEVNVLSGVRLSRAYLPGMRERNWGRIVFISSESGLQIPTESIAYGAVKAAVIATARGLAEINAGTGVTVNSILPGPTWDREGPRAKASLERSGAKTFDEMEKQFITQRRPTSIIQRFASPD